MREKEFLLLVNSFTTDQRAVSNAKPGLCRVWTREAIRIARQFREQNHIPFSIEARETEIEPFLLHTFLRIISEENIYVCDGSGTSNYQPFFGYEKDANHLQNSQLDMIHYLNLLHED